MGLSWVVLEPFGAVLSPFGGFLGHPGAILGASWAVLDAVEAKEANMLKMYVFLREWDDFCFLGVSLGASWGVLGASWTVLKPP